jgi:hypothetical protein
MKSIKAALLASKEETNITNTEKRFSKPLPIKPLPTPPTTLIIDDTSRNHISKLLNTWLRDLKIPIKPWADVLNKISIDLYQKSLSSIGENKQICIETLSVNAPKDSKFLMNVIHGIPINDGNKSVSFIQHIIILFYTT